MKTIFTILLGILSFQLFAAAKPGRISISVSGKENILVSVNGIDYKAGDNRLLIDDLQPGNHEIIVYDGQSTSRYNVFGRKKVLYSTSIYLKPGYAVELEVQGSGKALINEYELGRRGRKNKRFDDPFGDPYKQVMRQRDFEKSFRTLSRIQYENLRMDHTKYLVNMNYLGTEQVEALLELFPLDHRKLELAKFAYTKTLDRSEYLELAESFDDERCRRDFISFVRSQNEGYNY